MTERTIIVLMGTINGKRIRVLATNISTNSCNVIIIIITVAQQRSLIASCIIIAFYFFIHFAHVVFVVHASVWRTLIYTKLWEQYGVEQSFQL